MNVLADREPMRPPEQTRKNRKSHPGVLGNERLSALVGSVLLVLMLAEIVVAAQLHVLLSAHIVVGMLLTVPLLVKLGSVGYRFLSYYAGIRAYVRKGPPRLELRLLAPLLLVASVSLVMSGITLALLGPTNAWSVWVLRLHALSVICWLPLLALHVGVHIWRVPRLIIADWRNRATRVIPGRGWRYGITIFALLAGGGAAALFLPYTAAWVAWAPTLDPHIPGPLLFALFAAFLAGLGGLVVFRPWRWQEESGDRTRQS
ncbi:MAG TPA: hypothetical protein VKT82_00075 [Ktedonobacterales bacterium]|nr:hypothetical protein [Ktedonobacterales bacterium]